MKRLCEHFKTENPFQTLQGEEGLQSFSGFLMQFSTVLKNCKVTVIGYVLCKMIESFSLEETSKIKSIIHLLNFSKDGGSTTSLGSLSFYSCVWTITNLI